MPHPPSPSARPLRRPRAPAPCAIVAALGLALGAAGCEDGPGQTFQPSPSDAGARWNNGHTIPFVDNAYAEFIGPNGPPVAPVVCTDAQLATRWAAMLAAPIAPPRQAANLDLAGGDGWPGLALGDAEQIDCQSADAGDAFGGGNPARVWGHDDEVLVEVDPASRRVLRVRLQPGYGGALAFASRDGAHAYRALPGQPLTRDGAPLDLDWSAGHARALGADLDAIHRALLATFAPALGDDAPGLLCLDTGRCTRSSDDGVFGAGASWTVPVIGLTLWFDRASGAPPLPATVSRIDVAPVRTEPFSAAPALLALSGAGPSASAGTLGKAPGPCTLQLGMSYADLLTRCAQVSGDATRDAAALGALLGRIGHAREGYAFALRGLRPDFGSLALPANDVVRDGATPAPADLAGRLSLDELTHAALGNDRGGGALDLHGTGAVYQEFARRVRARLLALTGAPDGDLRLCRFPTPRPPGFDARAFVAAMPRHCTGLESLITPAPPSVQGDPTNLGPEAALALAPGLALGLRPGRPQALYCLDASGDPLTGYRSCASGDLLATTLAQVVRVLGKGQATALPVEARDLRLYFEQYARALIAYLHVGDQAPVPPLDRVTLDPDRLVLWREASAGGPIDVARYVDRRFAAQQPPLTVTVRADLAGGRILSYVFDRALTRPEAALEIALGGGGNPGARDDALLTSVFGSPVLARGWKAASTGRSAYACATADPPDPARCDGQTPPLDARGQLLRDEAGRPLLAAYPGAFAGASTPLSLGSTAIRITSALPAIASALLDIAPADALQPHVTVLAPWWPKQPGVGVAIPVAGAPDRFVATARLDLSGVTFPAVIDVDDALDPVSGKPLGNGAVAVLAVEADRFLGEVFLCQDPPSGDLLHARMYAPATTLLAWIAAHPAAIAACGLVVGYDRAGVRVQRVASTVNGVRLDLTGDDGSRVAGATLHQPGL